MLVKNTFHNNVVTFTLNITTFGMLIDNVEIDMLHDFGCYGDYEFFSYLTVCFL